FPVFIIHDDDHLAVPDGVNGLRDGIQQRCNIRDLRFVLDHRVENSFFDSITCSNRATCSAQEKRLTTNRRPASASACRRPSSSGRVRTPAARPATSSATRVSVPGLAPMALLTIKLVMQGRPMAMASRILCCNPSPVIFGATKLRPR